MAEIKGKAGLGNTQNEADKVQASLLKSDYEHYALTLGAPAVDANLVSLAPTAFAKVIRAHTIIIRCDANISVKFNDASNDPLPISAAEGGFTTNTLEVESIFLTAPTGANVKFFLV